MSNYTETKVGKYIIRKYNSGSEEWLCNEKHHREDGPSFKWVDGYKQYYLNGYLLSKKEYKLTSALYRINTIYE